MNIALGIMAAVYYEQVHARTAQLGNLPVAAMHSRAPSAPLERRPAEIRHAEIALRANTVMHLALHLIVLPVPLGAIVLAEGNLAYSVKQVDTALAAGAHVRIAVKAIIKTHQGRVAANLVPLAGTTLWIIMD